MTTHEVRAAFPTGHPNIPNIILVCACGEVIEARHETYSSTSYKAGRLFKEHVKAAARAEARLAEDAG